jgi:hypothetical protein
MAYRGNEYLLVETVPHALHDLMLEEFIRLGLPTEHAPLAPSPGSGLRFRRPLAILQASELTGGDHFGNPQTDTAHTSGDRKSATAYHPMPKRQRVV